MTPEAGLSDREVLKRADTLEYELAIVPTALARDALALGDISAVEDDIADALDAFNIRLDRQSGSYPKLGIEILRAFVRALQAIGQRNAGEPVPTPQVVEPSTGSRFCG